MNENEPNLVKKLHREAVGQPTIHYTELPADAPGSPLAAEWDLYRREVGRLLAQGHEDKWVLIKGEEIIGIFDTWDAARDEGLKRYLLQPMLVKQVLTREPILRVRGYNLPWPNSLSRSPEPG
jgi:hypothetical protein